MNPGFIILCCFWFSGTLAQAYQRKSIFPYLMGILLQILLTLWAMHWSLA